MWVYLDWLLISKTSSAGPPLRPGDPDISNTESGAPKHFLYGKRKTDHF